MDCIIQPNILAVLLVLLCIDILYVLYKTHKNVLSIDEETLHHIGSHILLMVGAFISIMIVLITDNTTAITLWGVYSLYHLHKESIDLTITTKD